MQRDELTELHYITAIENVASILEHGLLSHRRAESLPHRSVAMAEIQNRRAGKQIPGGRRLHDYVNLHLNGRNVMMAKVLYGLSVDEVCLLRVSSDVLDIAHVVVSDQNAASDYVRFAPAPDGLQLIDRTTTFASSWKHPEDQIAEWRHKSAVCAEVLVPDRVGPEHLLGAYVGSDAAKRSMLAAAPALEAAVQPYMFLR